MSKELRCLLVALCLPAMVLASESRSDAIMGKVEDLFQRWRHEDRSLGMDIPAVEKREWESLRSMGVLYRKEVESLAVDDEDRTLLLDEYLMVSEGVLSLFAAVAPDQLENINWELALTLPNPAPAFTRTLRGIKSDILIKADSEFELRQSDQEMVLSRSQRYLDSLVYGSELVRSSKNPDDLLFTVAQRGMNERLDMSGKIVERMLSLADGEWEVHESERERLVRNYFAAWLKESSQIEKAFSIDLSSLDAEWGNHFLKILLPDKSFYSEEVENFTVGFTDTMEDYMGHAFSIFLGKVLWAEVELGNLDSKELEAFLCGAFIDSFREGVDEAWLSLSESEGKEAVLRDFFRLSIPTSSCDVIYQWKVGAKMENIHKKIRTENPFDMLVERLAGIARITNDPQEFLKGPVDVEMAIRYYQVRNKDMEGDFNVWLNQNVEWQSYQEFRSAFLKEYVKQERVSNQHSDSNFLQKISENARENLSRMDEMRNFLRLNEDGRDGWIVEDLLGVNDSKKSRKILKDIFVQIQKNRYPILQTEIDGEILLEVLGEDGEKNRQMVRLALEKIRKKIQSSMETVNSWNKVEDMELALKNSDFLFLYLLGYPEVSGFFLQKYQGLRKDSNVKLMAKQLFHQYVGVGFGILILLDFGPAIFTHVFRWAKGSSYIKSMRPAIDPKLKHGFIVSAFAMIGIDLAYESWDIFGRELPLFQDARELFQSSAFSETSVFNYSEYFQMDEYMRSRKRGYYWQAGIDSVFLSLFLVPKIPWVKRQLPGMILNMTQKRLKRTQDKFDRAFKKLGMDPPYATWDKLVLKDIHRLRSRELKSRLLAHRDILIRLGANFNEVGQLSQSRKFRKVLQENPAAGKTLAAYDVTLAELQQVHSGYRFLLKEHDKFQKAWERYAQEHRFDFEQLGLPAGEWNWRAIDEAYGNFKELSQAGRISVEEFAFVQESYKNLTDFMMRKVYLMGQYPTLRRLFLDSIILREEQSTFLARYGQRLNEKGMQLGYDVFSVRATDGSSQELIVPNLHRQRLLKREN